MRVVTNSATVDPVTTARGCLPSTKMQGTSPVSDVLAIEKRDQELRHSLVPPTEAERDRRALLGTVARLKEAMREATSDLTGPDAEPPVPVARALEALRYALEQD